MLFGGAAAAQPATVDSSTDPAPAPADPASPAKPVSADDVRDAPKPGQEHGRLDPLDLGDGVGRWIGRVLLFPVRVPMFIVAQPVRGALYLQDRFYAAETIAALFYTEDKKLAIFPTVLVETGFGLNGGVRIQLKDLFGQGEKIRARGGYGGRFRQVATLDIDSGEAFGPRVSAGIDMRYELRASERFSGIGNNELETSMDRRDPVDPLGVATRYRMTVLRASPRVRLELPQNLWVTGTGAVIDKNYEQLEDADGSDRPIQEIYDPASIPGFIDGTRFLYTELEVAWDTRRPSHWLDPKGVWGTGGLVLAYAGRQAGLDDGATFYRIGVDLQRFLRFGPGPRVLELRGYAELVTGDREHVPFTELPRLGGVDLLRGYTTDRYRDRFAAVAQVNYLWMLSRYLGAVGFVDAGRVSNGVNAFTFEDLRVGFGGALEAYSSSGLLLRAQLATSIDGGITAFVSLDPVFGARSRVERY
ncbi:MAG: BamA/TamA family outer membrane protein [Kofleriaceae bacterium]